MSHDPRDLVEPSPKKLAESDFTQTILEFGGPLFTEVPENVTRAEYERVATMVIDVWNALVMATDAWGDPEPLVLLCREANREAEDGDLASSKLVALLEARWRKLFQDDSRRVVEWFVSPGRGAPWMLTCRPASPKA